MSLLGGGLRDRVLRSGGWTLFGNIAGQGLRFGSNLIMTRLLFPEAFGLMAIVFSIFVAVNLLTDVGLSQAVVRSPRGVESRFLNTVWTLQLAKGALVAVCLFFAGGIAARTYQLPELAQMIPIMGLVAMIGGLTSTKMALASRQLQVARLTGLELAGQCVGIITMLLWALAHPTPWALVAGNVASAVAIAVGSHVVLTGPGNRLAWDKTAAHEVLKFGGWVLMSSAVTYMAGEGRTLLMAAYVGAKEIGLIVLSTTLALVGWMAVQQVSGRTLFPAYAEVWRERRERLPTVVERSRRLQLLAGCVLGAVFAVFGDVVIRWLYDPRYAAAGAYLQIQAVGTIFGFLTGSYSGVLWAMGRPGLSTALLAVQVALMASLMAVGATMGGTLGMVVGLAATGAAMYPVTALAYRRFGLHQPRTDAPVLFLGVMLAFCVYQFGAWRGAAL